MDLAQGSAGGWVGSIVIPGLGIKGAALSNVVVTDTDVADIGKVLGTFARSRGFRAHLIALDGMAGEMRQAGNVAKFALTKIGPAQMNGRREARRSVQSSRTNGSANTSSAAIRAASRSPSKITPTPASAKFVIVGKMTNDLPVDLVVQQGNLRRVESQSTQVYFEGRILTDTGEIRGTIEVGPVELPLVLRRSSRRTS